MKRNRNASRRRLRVFAPEQLESRTLLDGGGWSAALDFGVQQSPVQPGFRQVLPLAYSASEGLGWVNPKAIFGLDRGGSDALRRDGHQGSKNTFLVDMPNGLYDITPTIGRISGAVDQISIRAEGQLVASNIATSSGEFVEPTFRLPVQDGQLALELIDEGGLTNTFGIVGLRIQQVMPPDVNVGADLSTDEGTDLFFKGTVTGTAPFSYAWDFGDGTVRTGSAEATHSYKDNGVYNAKLSVTDANGLTTVAGLFVTVSNVAPVPSINGPSTGEVDQTVSFSASALDAGAADVEAGFSFLWDFGDGTKGAGAQAQHAYAIPGTYSVKLTATDKDGGSATTTWETTIQGQGNTPPLLVPTGDQTIAEGEELTFVVTAYDWDVPAQELRFSLIGPPEGASIDPVSGVFSWTPTEAQGPGSYMFGIRVSDGQLSDEETITVTVTDVNSAPSLAPISNQTVAEGTELTITAVGTDPDLPAQTLTYSLVTGPEGAAIDAVSGEFRWTPTEAQGPGSFPVTIRVSDGILWAEQSFTATVTEVNSPPVLAAISNRAINEGSTLTLTASATDVDLPKQTLTYSLVSPPSGAQINASTGAFSWKPTEAQGPGTFTITVRVSDGSATDQKSFTVTVNEVNVAPVIAAISNQTVVEGNLLTLTVSASDADVPKQTLNYWLASPPAGAAINSSTGVFTWRPTEAQGPGSYTINVRVSDGLLTAQRSFTVSVTEFNSPPTLASISNQTIEQGRELKLTAIGSDPDLPAQTLTYSLVTAPTGASIDPVTGVLTWTPTTSQGPGSFPVTVRVSDGSLSADQSFSVTVTQPNTPPTLQAIPDQTVAEGTQLTVTAVATDTDLPAQTLTYSLLNPMDGAIFDTTTGVLTWTPTESQGPGSFSVTIQVSDGLLTDSQSFTITVTEVNTAPVLSPLGNRTITAGTPLTFTATATDADLPAQSLTYTLENAPAGASMNPSTGLFSWTPTLAQVATFTLSVLVSDGQLSDARSFTIAVMPGDPSSGPVIPRHYSHIRIAQLAYNGNPMGDFETRLLQESVDLVVSHSKYHSQIEAVAPSTPQLIYTNTTNLYLGLITDWANFADSRGFDREAAYYHVAAPRVFSGSSPSSQPVTWFWSVLRGNTTYTSLTSAARGGSSTGFSLGSSGESLVIGYPERFREVNTTVLTSASGGWNSVLEYTSAVDSNGVATEWKALSFIEDGTAGWTSSGRLVFDPPPDWVPSRVGGSERLYQVRVRTTAAGTAPVVKSLLGRDYVNANGTTSGTIPVFDTSVDVNADGYLNDTEYANRSSGKDARFVHESRLFHGSYGQMRFSTNPSREEFRAWASDYHIRYLASAPLADGLFMDNSSGRSPVASNITIESVATYSVDYAAMMQAIDVAIGDRWILANTVGGGNSTNHQIQAGIPYMEEFLIRPLAHNYTQFYEAANMISQRSTLTNPAPFAVLDSYPTNGSVTDPRTQIATLAYYYLIGDPDRTFLMMYGGYEPGTTWSRHWTDAIRQDIGRPEGNWSLFTSGTDPALPGAEYRVFQRPYQDALVLYKPLSRGGSGTVSLGDETTTVHQLDNQYRPLRADGTLGEPITSVSLRNGEGAILVRIPMPPTPPVARDDSYMTRTGTALSVPAAGVLVNDSDVNRHDVLSVVLETSPSHGIATLNADGSFTYTPTNGFKGTDSFTYRVSYGTFLSDPATVTIQVNDPPQGGPDSYTVTGSALLTIPAPGLLANDSDPNGDSISAELVSGPTNGTLTLNADGSFSYTANAEFYGTDVFTYRPTDGITAGNAVTVNITVNEVQLETLVDEDFNGGSFPTGFRRWVSDGTNHLAVSSTRPYSPSFGVSTNGGSLVSARAWIDSLAEADVRVSMNVSVDSLVPVMVLARGSNLDTNTPTYYGAVVTRGLQIELIKVVNGVTTSLGTLSSPDYISGGAWVRVTLEVSGDSVKARVVRTDTGRYLTSSRTWQTAAAWAIVVGDQSITGPGQAGLGRINRYSGAVYLDDFKLKRVVSS